MLYLLAGGGNMKIVLDVLENSKEFLFDSLDLYAQGYSDDNHENPKDVVLLRRKWKLAYISLVQAVELLLKHAIAMVAPNLLLPNVDAKPVIEKTITFEQCLSRIVNFTKIPIDDTEMIRLRNCAKLRNQLIHYKVDISTQEIQIRYSSLLKIYSSLYLKIEGKEIEWQTGEQKRIVSNLRYFEDNMTIKRGVDIRKTDIENFENDIALAQKHKYFINKNGFVRERIKLGEEHKYIKTEIGTLFDWPYCDDCTAKQGEYHLDLCDLERCPFCYGQALSCECEVAWCTDDKSEL